VSEVIGRAALVIGLALAASCTHAATPRHSTTTRPHGARPRHPAVAATVAPDAAVAVPGVEHGLAVWYASGKMTASGERFDKRKMAAAHRRLPFGTRVRVTADRTGKSVIVRINDRGPFGNPRRIIDLTEAAAEKIDLIDAGSTPVTIEILEAP
jgi:rare lipoprotein A